MANRFFISGFLLLLAVPFPLLAGDVEVLRYRIALELFMESSSVKGVVAIENRNASDPIFSVSYSLEGLKATEARVDGRRAAFQHTGNTLTVFLQEEAQPGEEFTVEVDYEGTPFAEPGGRGLFFTERGAHTVNRPSGAPRWFPCIDLPWKRAGVELFIRVPAALTAVSVGTLVQVKDEGDGTATYHWVEEHPLQPDWIGFAVSDYRLLNRTFSWGGTECPLQFYVFAEHEESAQAVLEEAEGILEFFSVSLSGYPFLGEKYAFAETVMGARSEAMGSLALLGEDLLTGAAGLDCVLARLAALQWWEGMAGPRELCDLWLSEGLASYGGALYEAHRWGADRLKERIGEWREAFAAWEEGGNLFPLYDPPWELFSSPLLSCKAPSVMNMLRFVMGDDAFGIFMKDLLRQYAFRGISTAQFQEVAEGAYGEELDWFFQAWIYGTGLPRFRFSTYISQESGGILLSVSLEGNGSASFETPVEVEWSTGSGLRRERVWVREGITRCFFTGAEPLDPPKLDPEGWLLHRGVHEERPVISSIRAGRSTLSVYWDPYFDTGISGFFVFRRKWGESDFQCLNATPLAGLSYIDDSVERGKKYTYGIRAVYQARDCYWWGYTSNYEDGITSGGAHVGWRAECFVATAACGSRDAWEVRVLRRLRDRVLVRFGMGRWVVEQYYRWGRIPAAVVSSSSFLRTVARLGLAPAAALAWFAVDLAGWERAIFFLWILAGIRFNVPRRRKRPAAVCSREG